MNDPPTRVGRFIGLCKLGDRLKFQRLVQARRSVEINDPLTPVSGFCAKQGRRIYCVFAAGADFLTATEMFCTRTGITSKRNKRSAWLHPTLTKLKHRSCSDSFGVPPPGLYLKA